MSEKPDVRVFVMDGPRTQTCYDINPNPEKKWFKIRCRVVCSKCKKDTLGDLIIERNGLKVVDSSGFMLFEDPMCDKCIDGGDE